MSSSKREDLVGWAIPLDEFDLGGALGVYREDSQEMLRAIAEADETLIGLDAYQIFETRLKHLDSWSVEQIGRLWYRNLETNERALKGAEDWIKSLPDTDRDLIIAPILRGQVSKWAQKIQE